MLYSMFDFENHNPEYVIRVMKNLYDHPDMCEWYNYVGDSEMAKTRVGDCMCWIRTVFQHTSDIDRLYDVFMLENNVMLYWVRDLYDAAMGYFDALNLLGVPFDIAEESVYLEDCVNDNAEKCYQRRAQTTYEHMSRSEKKEWDKLEFDVAVLIDDYLRDVMPDDLYSFDAASGHSKLYDHYVDYLKHCEESDTKSFARYVNNPNLWYREWYQIKPEYNPYLDTDPVIPLQPSR